MGIVYLMVSFDQKDIAKSMGAKWDPVKKLWYAPNDSYKELIETYGGIITNEKEKPVKVTIQKKDEYTIFHNEQKEFGNTLYIDIPPKKSSFILYKHLNSNDYGILKKTICHRCAYKCELCKEEDSKQIYLLERWDYLERLKIQKLVRIIGVCKKCYSTSRLRDKEIALEQLQWVNDWTEEEAKNEIRRGFYEYKKKNEIEWQLDISLLPYKHSFIYQEKGDKKEETKKILIKPKNIF